MLEVAIGDVCQLCSGLVKELESSGHPILDTLVKHVRPRPSPYPSLLSCNPADCGILVIECIGQRRKPDASCHARPPAAFLSSNA